MNLNHNESSSKRNARSEEVFPSENLAQLLLYLEEEIETRDRHIEELKEDMAKMIYCEAKYARVSPADPIHALSRDSRIVPDIQPQTRIGDIFNNQMGSLERFVNEYHKSHQRTLQMTKSAEYRLELAINDLVVERQWRMDAVPNDTMKSLKEENMRLKEQVERSNEALITLKKDMDKAELKRQTESERSKSILLFLMNERRELLSMMNEIQLKKNNESITSEQKLLIEELRKEVEVLRDERDSIRSENKKMEEESSSITHRSPMTTAQSRNLSSSSSFPSNKSHLPRAPKGSPNSLIASKTAAGKKNPAMGVSTMRRAVIDTRDTDNVTKLVRSSSLRGQSEPRPLGPSFSSFRPSTLPKSPSNANISPACTQPTALSRLHANADGKTPQTTAAKSSLLRVLVKKGG